MASKISYRISVDRSLSDRFLLEINRWTKMSQDMALPIGQKPKSLWHRQDRPPSSHVLGLLILMSGHDQQMLLDG